MSTLSLFEYQRVMGLHLRDPHRQPRPTGQSARRTSVYSTLVMNNIEGGLATALPVCKAVLGLRWPRLVRAFCIEARSHSPLFHELSGEFVQWLMQSPPTMTLPAWLLSLAHYEWAELAVEVMETPSIMTWANADWPDAPPDSAVQTNPALMALSYEWPVHRIGPQYRPRKPQPTQLLVYRNEHHVVAFQLVNLPTLRLIELLTPTPHSEALPTPLAACGQVAREMGRPHDDALIKAGLAQVQALLRAQVLVPDKGRNFNPLRALA